MASLLKQRARRYRACERAGLQLPYTDRHLQALCYRLIALAYHQLATALGLEADENLL